MFGISISKVNKKWWHYLWPTMLNAVSIKLDIESGTGKVVPRIRQWLCFVWTEGGIKEYFVSRVRKMLNMIPNFDWKPYSCFIDKYPKFIMWLSSKVRPSWNFDLGRVVIRTSILFFDFGVWRHEGGWCYPYNNFILFRLGFTTVQIWWWDGIHYVLTPEENNAEWEAINADYDPYDGEDDPYLIKRDGEDKKEYNDIDWGEVDVERRHLLDEFEGSEVLTYEDTISEIKAQNAAMEDKVCCEEFDGFAYKHSKSCICKESGGVS